MKVVSNIHLLERGNAACLLSYFIFMWYCGVFSVCLSAPFPHFSTLCVFVTVTTSWKCYIIGFLTWNVPSHASARLFSIEVTFINECSSVWELTVIPIYRIGKVQSKLFLLHLAFSSACVPMCYCKFLVSQRDVFVFMMWLSLKCSFN